MNPAGSFLPGVISFAITPAMNPIMMVQMIPTELSRLDDSDPAGVFEAASQNCGQGRPTSGAAPAVCTCRRRPVILGTALQAIPPAITLFASTRCPARQGRSLPQAWGQLSAGLVLFRPTNPPSRLGRSA